MYRISCIFPSFLLNLVGALPVLTFSASSFHVEIIENVTVLIWFWLLLHPAVPFDGVLHVYNWSWRVIGISCRGAVGDFPSLVVIKWSIVLLSVAFLFAYPKKNLLFLLLL